MNKAGRGWSHASQMKPAVEYDIRYGSGLLKKESSGWPRYLMVSTPTAYRTAQPYLSKPPVGVSPCDVVRFQTSTGDKRQFT